MSKKKSSSVFKLSSSDKLAYEHLLARSPGDAAELLAGYKDHHALKLSFALKKTVIVTNNLELPGIPPLPKKRGRPFSLTAKSNAERQRDFRIAFKNKVQRAITSHALLVSSSSAVLVATLSDAVRLAGSDSVFSPDICTILDELKKRYSNA